MLAECGEAEVQEVDCGIFVSTDDAVRLDEDARELFELPSPWSGGMRLATDSVPNLPGFTARLGLVDPLASVTWDWQLRGPILEVAGEKFLPTAAQFAALAAFKLWQSFPAKDELTHLSLLCSLREAHDAGCLIDLEAYRGEVANIVRASELTIHTREDPENGDLILCPLPHGGFPDVTVDEIEQRIAQLDGGEPRKVLRVGKRIILLDDEQTAIARAVKTRSRVPLSARKDYERDPVRWLSDHVFPDVPVEFSPRVTGIGTRNQINLNGAGGEPEDWFAAKPEFQDVAASDSNFEDTQTTASSDSQEPEEELPAVELLTHENLNALEYGKEGARFSSAIPTWQELESDWPSSVHENYLFKPKIAEYPRQPMPHQDEGIRWLLAHARRALKRRDNPSKTEGWGAGALLADDMGLGKSFTTLIALAEWYRHWREITNAEPPAVLLVVPLSLMENWQAEINAAFGNVNGPFLRVVMAQPDFELHHYRRSPGAVDIAEPGNVREFGLCFGDGTERSLDLPGSCVITTYQTLRDYRFSFAAAEWGAAIFDEAQNIKNPNAQQTIAAKALRALFRITLTGTPVENHLGDFWCILDTAEPGPLGAFADFRKKWIAPMIQDRARMHDIGRELRDQIGGLMLRRTKEERLSGLPGKSIVPVDCPMTTEQEELYADARESVNNTDPAADSAAKGQHLAALWHLRQTSLHPDLIGGGSIPVAKTEKDCRRILGRSGKLAWLLSKLDEVRAAGEKVLVFCVLKHLQEALSAHLEVIYGLPVPIINGDTKATFRRSPEKTRLGLIEAFSKRPGFGVCVLSPIAAGAGLNIIAANHVIHLERHWNPAKEDQATDRAYRIGQQKPVTVYLPIANHSEFSSFDAILHRLLQKKRTLQGAVGLVPPDSVSAPELISELFGLGDKPGRKLKAPISLDEALHLSWEMFESLIAVLYERESERVILTPQSADHGSDVIVLGWGPSRTNVLIQCKFTKNDKLDSEEGVRAVCSSAPFFEKPLGVTFTKKVLHTTARKFGKRSKRSAQICSVDLHGRDWLESALAQYRPTLSQIMERSYRREKIGC